MWHPCERFLSQPDCKTKLNCLAYAPLRASGICSTADGPSYFKATKASFTWISVFGRVKVWEKKRCGRFHAHIAYPGCRVRVSDNRFASAFHCQGADPTRDVLDSWTFCTTVLPPTAFAATGKPGWMSKAEWSSRPQKLHPCPCHRNRDGWNFISGITLAPQVGGALMCCCLNDGLQLQLSSVCFAGWRCPLMRLFWCWSTDVKSENWHVCSAQRRLASQAFRCAALIWVFS